MTEVPGQLSVARRPSDRQALVEYIEATANLQETAWLEWKSAYDLTTASGQASTAKHIIGFANRMPDVAARYADGHAYLLLGVEPGMFHGMPVHDSADIENWLSPYVGADIVYDLDYVTAGGVTTLLFIVDPPKWGDNIHSLRKESADELRKTMRQGSVYVRKSGKTEMATAGDIDRLTERARRRDSRLQLSVEAEGALVAAPAHRFTDSAREIYLRDRREALLSPLPRSSDPTAVISYALSDTRSPDRFRREVEQWVETIRAAWPLFALANITEADPQSTRLVIVNDTEENFESVRVEVSFPLPSFMVHETGGGFRYAAKLPREPVGWGKGLTSSLMADIDLPSFRRNEDLDIEDQGDGTLVTFPPIDVSPHSRHKLGVLVLSLMPNLAGAEMQALWRATSKSTRGDLSGAISLPVG